MENTIKPDMKYWTAQILILAVISGITLISAGVLHLIINYSNPDPEATLVLWSICCGANIVMWVISYPIIHLYTKNLTYIIQDDRVTILSGILTKKEQNIPYRSITDFVLKRGPFDRYLGIGTIQVQTAGQSQTATGYEGCLSGLIDFDSVHGDLRNKLKSLHPVSESTTTSEPLNISNENVLSQILEELKEIRRNTEK
ncbi:MAG: PH domain-containing protein [Candidatus Marinimicrobia bacterium]|nr:PH domain-containing protein [Candidatus Neomarinimicrobiota bacterium]